MNDLQARAAVFYKQAQHLPTGHNAGMQVTLVKWAQGVRATTPKPDYSSFSFLPRRSFVAVTACSDGTWRKKAARRRWSFLSAANDELNLANDEVYISNDETCAVKDEQC